MKWIGSLFGLFVLFFLLQKYGVQGTCTPQVGAFYSLEFGVPKIDGQFYGWDKAAIIHWDPEVQIHYTHLEGEAHSPPDDVFSLYYPEKGLYSSRDKETILGQLRQMAQAGIDVVIVNWWGKPTDTKTRPRIAAFRKRVDEALQVFFDAADTQKEVKVMFHLQNYLDRTVETVQSDVQYLHDKYSKRKSTFKTSNGRVVLFLYDSYQIDTESWKRLLEPEGDLHLGLAAPTMYVGLYLDESSVEQLHDAGFTGGYTYFASSSTSTGSNPENWKSMSHSANANGLLFIPSVAPGYEDNKLRPWNGDKRQARNKGKYFDDHWKAALESGAAFVTITSYNDWGDGSQIEPAADINDPDKPFLAMAEYDAYKSYTPLEPSWYLNRVSHWKSQICEHAISTSIVPEPSAASHETQKDEL